MKLYYLPSSQILIRKVINHHAPFSARAMPHAIGQFPQISSVYYLLQNMGFSYIEASFLKPIAWPMSTFQVGLGAEGEMLSSGSSTSTVVASAPGHEGLFCYHLCGLKQRRGGGHPWIPQRSICTCWDSPDSDVKHSFSSNISYTYLKSFFPINQASNLKQEYEALSIYGFYVFGISLTVPQPSSSPYVMRIKPQNTIIFVRNKHSFCKIEKSQSKLCIVANATLHNIYEAQMPPDVLLYLYLNPYVGVGWAGAQLPREELPASESESRRRSRTRTKM